MAEYDNKVLTGEQLGVFSGLVKSAINEKQDELVFNTAYNSVSNKVATMADLPTVPTNVSAFTNDSGYLTQHQSLSDYALKSELFSGSYNDLTDKPTIPPAYTLPTATTSVLGGVKVDGSTITIADGVISAAGASYTAGDGVNIDVNNVISLKQPVNDTGNLFLLLLKNGTFTTGLTNLNNTILKSPSNKNDCIDAFLKGYIVNAQASITITYSELGLSDYLKHINFWNARNDGTWITTSASSVSQITLTAGRFYYYNNSIIYEWRNAVDIWSQMPFYTPDNSFSTIGAYLKTVSTKLLPAEPSNDGNYKLNCAISSGTATYSWGADTAAYTLPTASTSTLGGVKVDGTTITITDGVISADSQLPSEPSEDGVFKLLCGVDDGVASYFWDVDTSGTAIEASNVIYDNTTSGLTASDVQNAIDELAASSGSGGGGGASVSTTTTNGGLLEVANGNVIGINVIDLHLKLSGNVMGTYRYTYSDDTPASVKQLLYDEVMGVYQPNHIYRLFDDSGLGFLPSNILLMVCNKPGNNGVPYILTTPIYIDTAGNNNYRLQIQGLKAINNASFSSSDGIFTWETMYVDNLLPAKQVALVAGSGITLDSYGNISVSNPLPSGPTNDGTYVLKCTVSSGTPTYTWVVET